MTILSDAHVQHLREKFRPYSFTSGGGEKTFGEVLKAVEVVGVGGAMSYLNARHAAAGRNAYEVAGVPADLALGLLFSGLAITGYFGEHASHGQNVGLGFLAAYACRMGSVWGGTARAQHLLVSGGGGNQVRGAFAGGSPQTTHSAAPVSPYAWAE